MPSLFDHFQFSLEFTIDLTFQFPMQYRTLQHHFFSPPNTSTTGRHFHFGPASSFFLKLFLLSSQEHVGHLPTWRGVHFLVSFLFLFRTVYGAQKYWSSLPFPPAVDIGLLSFVEARLVFWNTVYLLTNPKSLFQPQTSLPNMRLLNRAAYWTSPLGCSSRHFQLPASESASLTPHLPTLLPCPHPEPSPSWSVDILTFLLVSPKP